MDWLIDLVKSLHISLAEVVGGALLFVITLVGSLAIVAVVLVKLPATYFCLNHPPMFAWEDRHPAWRWSMLIAKNLLGYVVVIAGIVQSLPGVPGQGILTILLGVMLLDFPGKRRFERNLVSRPSVFGAINRIRGRFNKPPLVLEDEKTAAENANTMKQV